MSPVPFTGNSYCLNLTKKKTQPELITEMISFLSEINIKYKTVLEQNFTQSTQIIVRVK